MIRFLRNLRGRRKEDRIKELVNEMGQELGVEEKQTSRDVDPNGGKSGKEPKRT